MHTFYLLYLDTVTKRYSCIYMFVHGQKDKPFLKKDLSLTSYNAVNRTYLELFDSSAYY